MEISRPALIVTLISMKGPTGLKSLTLWTRIYKFIKARPHIVKRPGAANCQATNLVCFDGKGSPTHFDYDHEMPHLTDVHLT